MYKCNMFNSNLIQEILKYQSVSSSRGACNISLINLIISDDIYIIAIKADWISTPGALSTKKNET